MLPPVMGSFLEGTYLVASTSYESLVIAFNLGFYHPLVLSHHPPANGRHNHSIQIEA